MPLATEKFATRTQLVLQLIEQLGDNDLSRTYKKSFE